MIDGVRNAILLILKLTAIYAVWLSVLKMMEATGLDKKLSGALKPIIKRVFKGESDKSYQWISVNLASNMLGMGGASTPAGIKAMNSMCIEEGKATDNMLMLLVINATSIQIIPATVIALRATAGSTDASSVFLPTLISTLSSTIIGGILCKLFSKKPDAKIQNKNARLSNSLIDLNGAADSNGILPNASAYIKRVLCNYRKKYAKTFDKTGNEKTTKARGRVNTLNTANINQEAAKKQKNTLKISNRKTLFDNRAAAVLGKVRAAQSPSVGNKKFATQNPNVGNKVCTAQNSSVENKGVSAQNQSVESKGYTAQKSRIENAVKKKV
jgi:spore maturation protein A